MRVALGLGVGFLRQGKRGFLSPKGAVVNSQGGEPLVIMRDVSNEPQRGDSKLLVFLGEHAMPQSFGSLHCHLVFSTKHRLAQISDELQPRLVEYVGGILRNQGCALIAAGGIPDHVHLLASMSRTLAVADTVRIVKTNSSAWIHDEIEMREFQWQEGYGAFAVSYSAIDAVKMYIANQAEHNRVVTFQDEFREFLRRHHLEWDEQYVWD
jgi:REP element-mobilizing transposase RayT